MSFRGTTVAREKKEERTSSRRPFLGSRLPFLDTPLEFLVVGTLGAILFEDLQDNTR